MIRVLHLIKEYTGDNPLYNAYVKALPDDRFRSFVCYLTGPPDGLNGLDTIAAEVIYLGFTRKYLKSFRLRVIGSIGRIVQEKKIDIIHCQRHKATVIAAITASISGRPKIISHVHGLNRTRSWRRRFTNRFVLRNVEKLIAVSNSVRSDILKSNWNIDPKKVVTVRNGINLGTIDSITSGRRDARRKLGIPEDHIVFGTVGRLVATKGQTYLIDAFSEVRKKIPDTGLVIIGDGSLSGELRKKTEALELSPHVFFAGYRKDVLELIRGFDVFVLPSLAEGLSLALLEAMASGIPVIASNIGGIPEVLSGCDCGRLVPIKDIFALSSAMLEISSLSADKKKRLGDRGRKRIEEAFSVEIMQKNIRKVYESILVSGC